MTAATEQSSTGLPANVAAALAYVLGPITGVVFLVLEKKNRYVRYHAAHSVAVGVALFVAGIALAVLSSVLAIVPVLGWLVALMANLGFALATFALWIFLLLQAMRGNEWEAPVVGKYARQYVTPVAA